MNRILSILSFFGLFIGLIVVFLTFTKYSTKNIFSESTNNEPSVVATVFPIYDIARNIAGNDIQVQLLLPPGASPHTFELSPVIMSRFSQADLVFAIGHGLDDWAIDQVSDDRLMVVDKNIPLRATTEESSYGEEDHEDGPIDPHYWLSGENGKIIAQNIADSLKEKYPQFTDGIDARLQSYLAELQAAHETTHTILNEVGTKRIVTLHDAWYYFADEYGLTIIATYTPSAGKDPLPQDLVHLSEVIQENGIQTFYAERQTSTSSLQAFLEDQHLQVATLDELGGLEGTMSYIDLLLYNANVFASQP